MARKTLALAWLRSSRVSQFRGPSGPRAPESILAEVNIFAIVSARNVPICTEEARLWITGTKSARRIRSRGWATVSGAAEVLGVHHATVIRHIDALEQRLGVKLFQRHARGYTATEAGQDLLQVGPGHR